MFGIFKYRKDKTSESNDTKYPTKWENVYLCEDCGLDFLDDPLHNCQPCPECGNCGCYNGAARTITSTRRKVLIDGSERWEYSGKYTSEPSEGSISNITETAKLLNKNRLQSRLTPGVDSAAFSASVTIF